MSSDLLVCTYCNKSCKGQRGLNIHLRSCEHNSNKQLCSFCNKIVPDLILHESKCKSNPNNHNTICKFCGGKRKDIITHMAKCDYNPENRKICPFCGKRYCGIENCILNPINIDVPCEFCHIKLPQKRIINHQRTCRSNPNLVTCEICNHLIELEKYQDHLSHCNHRFNLVVICSFCGNSFHMKDFDEHISRCRTLNNNIPFQMKILK